MHKAGNINHPSLTRVQLALHCTSITGDEIFANSFTQLLYYMLPFFKNILELWLSKLYKWI